MGIRFLAAAAGTGLLLSAGAASPRAAAQTTTSAASPRATLGADSAFIQMAGSLGLLQVKLGKVAQDKGSSPGVKDFGKRMVDDYSKTNEELAAAAKQAAYPAPLIMREHKQMFDRISRTGRSSFDKTYMSEMVKEHGDAVRLFQQEAESGRVASLKELAARMLPGLQQQLALATQTAGSVGADVTASNTGERQGT
jgi:putative membrane protein